MYNFERILDRRNNGSMKWSQEYIKKRFNIEDEKYYPLFIADMDYRLPDEIVDSMVKVIKDGDFGYFNIKESFMNSIRLWYKKVYDCDIENNWIVPSIGALTSMNIIMKQFLKKEDDILIFTPVYGPFKDIILNNDMNLISEKLILKNNRYYIDFESLKDKVKKYNIKSIVFCNPHNPSGRCWNEFEIRELVNICKEENIMLISDEVHGDLVLNQNKFISLAKYFDVYEGIIVVSAPNKTFNIAGTNISTYIVKNNSIREKLIEVHSKEKLHPNRLGCEFLTICYEKGYEWVQALNKNIAENISLAINMLDEQGVNIMVPDAGYLIWIYLDDVDNIDKFILELANETGVLLETGTRFIKDNNGWFRLNVATNQKILKESIPKMLEFYKKYRYN